MSDVLVIKVKMYLTLKELNQLHNSIVAQKETGVVLLPPYCTAQIVPDDIEIKFKTQAKGEKHERI